MRRNMADDDDGELVIDDSNFGSYFFDITKNAPKKGQVLAKYTAMADFVKGDVKDYIIETLLTNPMGAEMATQVMKYHCHATDEYATSVPMAIAKDMADGMTREEVSIKSYRFQIEYFYWTEAKYVPKGDLHWECIAITRADFAEAMKELDDMEKKEQEADQKIANNS